jgi:dTDP-4-dehydrorhamnose 3,5-epimerase
MQFIRTDVIGSWLIEPSPHRDARGRFMRAWCEREFAEHGIDFAPRQANMAFSLHAGTVRGMHYQSAPALEAKLVRCTRGAVFDVVVDMRTDSPTYRGWYGARLSAEDGRMLFVPEGCAHGCQSLEDETEILYMASAFFAPESVRGIRHDDPALGIRWPLATTMVSAQDLAWPLLD